MSGRLMHFVGSVILIFAMFFPLSASAKGVFFFNTGDELFSVGKLPANLAEEYPDDFELGYYCKHFGIFWADVWTWDCKLSAVSMENETYSELPASDLVTLEKQYSTSDAQRGIWNHYGVGILVLIIAGYLFWQKRRS